MNNHTLQPGMLVVGVRPYICPTEHIWKPNHSSLSSIFIVINLEELYKQEPQRYRTPKAKPGYTAVVPAMLGVMPTWKGKALNVTSPYYEVLTEELAIVNPNLSNMPHFAPYLILPESFNSQILQELEQISSVPTNDMPVEHNKNSESDTDYHNNSNELPETTDNYTQ